MLSTDTHTNALIIDNIRSFHKDGVLLQGYAALGISINPSVSDKLEINYGYADTIQGKIVIKRGQYEVVELTNESGDLVPLSNYNHSGDNIKYQDYVDALKCTNLNPDQKKVSAMIILTSESARSEMVQEGINKLLEATYGTLDSDVWDGLKFAFNNYSHTAKLAGYKIKAGETPWTPLINDNYLVYIQSDKYTGAKSESEKSIRAVEQYINPEEVTTESIASDEKPLDDYLTIVYPFSYVLDTSNNKQFIFNFSFEDPSETGTCNNSNSRYVSYELLRKDQPSKTVTWKGCLQATEPEAYELSFDDNTDVNGTIKLYKSTTSSLDWIWLEVTYGEDLQEQFEGNIMLIPRG